MKILSIETSCDETAVALVEATGGLDKPKFEVLAKAVNSQIEIHKEFGGVFPSMAKREHAKNIVPVLEEVLSSYFVIPAQAGTQAIPKSFYKGLGPCLRRGDELFLDDELAELLNREPGLFESTIEFLNTHEKPDIDMIAVTSGPGLEPALWVGINFARALSIVWQIPLIAVNHMEGHMASVLLNTKRSAFAKGFGVTKVKFPALALLISGGHTELVDIENWNQYKILGKTRDDAVGESYDKVARLMGFPYPGGPQISKLAEKYRKEVKPQTEGGLTSFPRPMINSGDLDFSFSGLKTAVLYKIRDLTKGGLTSLDGRLNLQIAGEFEQAVVDVLISKIGKALNTQEYKNIISAGGVTANEYIKSNISELARNYGIDAFFPDLADSTDNAQMIACAGYLKSFKTKPEIGLEIKADGNLTY